MRFSKWFGRLALVLALAPLHAGTREDKVVGKDRIGRAITIARLQSELDFRGATLDPDIRLGDDLLEDPGGGA